MTKEEYAARLNSPAWGKFSAKLKAHGGNICHMCGSPRLIQCHHMRYGSLGTPREWRDIALLCDACHDGYHERVRCMPTFKASRDELMTELASALMRVGRDVSTYLNHGDNLNAHWLANKVTMDDLLLDGSRGKTTRKNKKRHAELKRMYWNSKRC